MPLSQRRKPAKRRPKLLPHYPALVEFVHNNRFAVASQVQRRFPDWLRSRRTAQYQLANLCRLGYLSIAPVRSTGPHFPHVFSATSRGVRFVRDEYERFGLPCPLSVADDGKASGHTMTAVLHELMLTEFGLALHETVGGRGDVELWYSERRFFRRERQLYYDADGKRHRVIPDFGFSVRTMAKIGDSGSQNPRDLLHLLEWDNSTMSLLRFREKYRHYLVWSDSEQGRGQLARLCHSSSLPSDAPSFRLLVVAHNKDRPDRDTERLADLLAEALELPAAMRERIWLTTAQRLNSHPVPLNASIWTRARDARSWLNDYRSEWGSTARRRGRGFVRRRRHHVLEKLPAMPLHRLLPRHLTA